ncbi:MAG TPA: glycosyltransferase family 2 protein [Mycobacteriales bacterium]|nr:glycosyltransferase family 2 protein [Mycobacteriales bacterium]
MTRATVVIVNWNGAHLLGPCLDALAKQDVSDFETVVADNASTDGSVELLRRDYPWVRVVETGANLGFAGGNNAALRTCTTPFVVLLNNDAVPEPSWLRQTLAALDEQPDVGVVTPKIVFLPRFARLSLRTEGFTPGGADPRELGVRVHAVTVGGEPAKPLWERLSWGYEPGAWAWTRPEGELLLPLPDSAGPHRVAFTWAAERDKDVTLSWDGGAVTLRATAGGGEASFDLPGDVPRLDVVNNAGGIVLREGYGADRGFQEVDEGQYDAREEVFSFCGNGAAFRREVLDTVGLFDDDFFLYYEDTDLSWRVRAAGWRIAYEPTAVLRHHHSASSGETSPVFQFHVQRNRLLMLTKNASRPLAVRQVLRYPLTVASIARRTLRQGLAARARPDLSQTRLQVRVCLSYLRLLPAMLRRRREIDRSRTVPRAELERWLVTRR